MPLKFCFPAAESYVVKFLFGAVSVASGLVLLPNESVPWYYPTFASLVYLLILIPFTCGLSRMLRKKCSREGALTLCSRVCWAIPLGPYSRLNYLWSSFPWCCQLYFHHHSCQHHPHAFRCGMHLCKHWPWSKRSRKEKLLAADMARQKRPMAYWRARARGIRDISRPSRIVGSVASFRSHAVRIYFLFHCTSCLWILLPFVPLRATLNLLAAGLLVFCVDCTTISSR